MSYMKLKPNKVFMFVKVRQKHIEKFVNVRQ